MLDELPMEEKPANKPTAFKKILILAVYVVSIAFFLCAFYQVYLVIGIFKY
jgi:hypothetical protein